MNNKDYVLITAARNEEAYVEKTLKSLIAQTIRPIEWVIVDDGSTDMLGWLTKSFSNLEVIHHRYTGSADGTWGGWVKSGRANYISSYHPVFMFLKCLRRAFKKPYLVFSVGLFYSFVSGYIEKIPQVEDKALIAYLRKQQLNRLLLKEIIWKQIYGSFDNHC
jgi:biofilm PGA synthesis N-glycosyltransferase PgaC